MRVRSYWVCVVVFVLGCASAPRLVEVAEITADELLAGVALGVEQDPPGLVDGDEVLAVSADMRRFLGSNVDLDAGSYNKLRRLVDAIIGSRTFGLEYDQSTRTASEMFRLRRGNCLSFSNMFIALARHVGLNVQFQEVDVPPDWTMENDAFVLIRHINVKIDLGLAGEYVVDLNMGDFRTGYDRRAISDSRARAHYFNNLGVERMQEGDTAPALCYFRRAIAEDDRRLAPAWTNLGILYLRTGHAAHAEAAYLEALKVNPEDYVAMSNLVGLYQRMGDVERAAVFKKRAVRHRMRNPYYRFQLAREAISIREYDLAIGHLKYAIRKKRNEDRFYFLLGLSYLHKGKERAARRWMTRAERVSATDALKRTYSSKIDILLSGAE